MFMHMYFFSHILTIVNCFGTFLIISFSFPLFLFTLVVSMAPKRKSTPARNPLHSGAFSSSDSTPLSFRFRDDDAHKAFLENFSRRGVHSERQVILVDFADTDLPTVIHNREWESLCASRSLVLSCLSRSFTPICTRLIIQYLFSSLAFEVHAFLLHCKLLLI